MPETSWTSPAERADLFLSIHLNSMPTRAKRSRTRGIETYFLSPDATDASAGAVAAAAGAARLLMLTDVPGVLDDTGRLIKEMTIERAKTLIQAGTISGGMIPKVETCLEAVEQGVEAAVIVDGRVPHAVLLELFTPSGAGTLIRAR